MVLTLTGHASPTNAFLNLGAPRINDDTNLAKFKPGNPGLFYGCAAHLGPELFSITLY
jgi:hypothetical protein